MTAVAGMNKQRVLRFPPCLSLTTDPVSSPASLSLSLSLLSPLSRVCF